MYDDVNVAENLRIVRERMAEAALRARRDPSTIQLVAVSKTLPARAVLAAWQAGQCDFGENRPEEGAQKIPEVERAILEEAASTVTSRMTWHMIGHVQSRKTSMVTEHFDVVHSLDRLKFARKLNDLALESGRTMPVLIECNVSGEAGKYGYPVFGWAEDQQVRERFFSDVAQLLLLKGLRCEGLMTMAPLVEQAETVRWVFASLRSLRDALVERFPDIPWRHLSMGMTNDFEVAVEEGATLVRIGRAIFGSR